MELTEEQRTNILNFRNISMMYLEDKIDYLYDQGHISLEECQYRKFLLPIFDKECPASIASELADIIFRYVQTKEN